MGQEGLLLVGWLARGGPLHPAGSGSRSWSAAGFRPNPHQAAALAPVWTAALARAGIDPAGIKLYVQRSAELNAYSVGGRSVAVTTGVLR
jgi:Zn-dependent protease with chaperone function